MFIFEEFSYARQSYDGKGIPFTVVPLMMNKKRELRCFTDAHVTDVLADWLILFTDNYTGEDTAYFLVPACSACLIEIQEINSVGE